MQSIRQIQELNKRELEAGVSISASWHNDYRDTAFIYIGGLPLELSEGDVITVFSQFGEPTYINLVRDKDTGKSKGFCFLKYEDQRSTDLAVDNLGGATLMGRILKVDHTRYKVKEGEVIKDNTYGEPEDAVTRADDTDDERSRRKRSESEEEDRPLLKEEEELEKLLRNHDEDDPMKEYLVKQKREEVAEALERYRSEQGSKKRGERKHGERRHRSHIEHRDDDDRRRHHHRRHRDEDGDVKKERVKREESEDRVRGRRAVDGDERRDKRRHRQERLRSRSPAIKEEEDRPRRRRDDSRRRSYSR